MKTKHTIKDLIRNPFHVIHVQAKLIMRYWARDLEMKACGLDDPNPVETLRKALRRERKKGLVRRVAEKQREFYLRGGCYRPDGTWNWRAYEEFLQEEGL